MEYTLLTAQVSADLDTPVSAYLKLANTPYSYLFESVQGGEKWGRYSIIGLHCKTVIKIYGNNVKIYLNEELTEDFTVENIFKWIEEYKSQFKVLEDNAVSNAFNGGLVGFFAYDIIRQIESKLSKHNKKSDLGTPDILLMQSEEVLIFDSLLGQLNILVLAKLNDPVAYKESARRLVDIQKSLRDNRINLPETTNVEIKESDFKYHFSQNDFKKSVDKIKQYITDGDVMQVVLSQRMSIDFKTPPINLYRALRRVNPSPYMFYLNLGDTHIVGSSPEILVKLEEDTLTVRPIAGTRKRGKTTPEDLSLEQDLLSDAKEIAEHLMLIDLGRNDISKVSKVGSVKLTDSMTIERYSHVMHIVSNVTGTISPGLSPLDVLQATFPAGTVSGAPKIRAMEIIDELESIKRDIYSGAIGYLGWNDSFDTAIAIRTAVIKNDTLYIQAGAGIVYDSIPQNEWEETVNKAKALIHAAQLAAKGDI